MSNVEYQQEQIPVPDNTIADAEPPGKFLSFAPMSASQKCRAKCSIFLLYFLVITSGILSAVIRGLKTVKDLPNFSSE